MFVVSHNKYDNIAFCLCIHSYAIELAELLDQKEMLVYKLQSRLEEFQSQLKKEQELSQRVTHLSNY